MSDLSSNEWPKVENFCWDNFVQNMRAKLTPEEHRKCMIGDQLSSLGASVFEMRDELGRTIEDVALYSGVKTKLVSRLENFEFYPSLEDFVSIIHELGGEVIVVKRGNSPRSGVAEDHRGCSHDS
jgi:hypothetical protein